MKPKLDLFKSYRVLSPVEVDATRGSGDPGAVGDRKTGKPIVSSQRKLEGDPVADKTLPKKKLNIPIGETTVDPDYYSTLAPNYKLPKSYVRHTRSIVGVDEANIAVDYHADAQDQRWLRECSALLGSNPSVGGIGGGGVANGTGSVSSSAEQREIRSALSVASFEAVIDMFERYTAFLANPVSQYNFHRLVIDKLSWSETLAARLLPQLYAYWVSKRQRLGKPLCRKYWPQAPSSDGDPHVVFRARDREKYRLRKQQKRNDVESFRKMQQLRKDFAVAKTLLELVLEREALKEADFEIQRAIFEQKLFDAGMLPPSPPDPGPGFGPGACPEDDRDSNPPPAVSTSHSAGAAAAFSRSSNNANSSSGSNSSKCNSRNNSSSSSSSGESSERANGASCGAAAAALVKGSIPVSTARRKPAAFFYSLKFKQHLKMKDSSGDTSLEKEGEGKGDRRAATAGAGGVKTKKLRNKDKDKDKSHPQQQQLQQHHQAGMNGVLDRKKQLGSVASRIGMGTGNGLLADAAPVGGAGAGAEVKKRAGNERKRSRGSDAEQRALKHHGRSSTSASASSTTTSPDGLTFFTVASNGSLVAVSDGIAVGDSDAIDFSDRKGGNIIQAVYGAAPSNLAATTTKATAAEEGEGKGGAVVEAEAAAMVSSLIHPKLPGPRFVCQPAWPSFMDPLDTRKQHAAKRTVSNYIEDLELPIQCQEALFSRKWHSYPSLSTSSSCSSSSSYTATTAESVPVVLFPPVVRPVSRSKRKKWDHQASGYEADSVCRNGGGACRDKKENDNDAVEEEDREGGGEGESRCYLYPSGYECRARLGRGGRLVMDRIPIYDELLLSDREQPTTKRKWSASYSADAHKTERNGWLGKSFGGIGPFEEKEEDEEEEEEEEEEEFNAWIEQQRWRLFHAPSALEKQGDVQSVVETSNGKLPNTHAAKPPNNISHSASFVRDSSLRSSFKELLKESGAGAWKLDAAVPIRSPTWSCALSAAVLNGIGNNSNNNNNNNNIINSGMGVRNGESSAQASVGLEMLANAPLPEGRGIGDMRQKHAEDTTTDDIGQRHPTAGGTSSAGKAGAAGTVHFLGGSLRAGSTIDAYGRSRAAHRGAFSTHKESAPSWSSWRMEPSWGQSWGWGSSNRGAMQTQTGKLNVRMGDYAHVSPAVLQHRRLLRQGLARESHRVVHRYVYPTTLRPNQYTYCHPSHLKSVQQVQLEHQSASGVFGSSVLSSSSSAQPGRPVGGGRGANKKRNSGTGAATSQKTSKFSANGFDLGVGFNGKARNVGVGERKSGDWTAAHSDPPLLSNRSICLGFNTHRARGAPLSIPPTVPPYTGNLSARVPTLQPFDPEASLQRQAMLIPAPPPPPKKKHRNQYSPKIIEPEQELDLHPRVFSVESLGSDDALNMHPPLQPLLSSGDAGTFSEGFAGLGRGSSTGSTSTKASLPIYAASANSRRNGGSSNKRKRVEESSSSKGSATFIGIADTTGRRSGADLSAALLADHAGSSAYRPYSEESTLEDVNHSDFRPSSTPKNGNGSGTANNAGNGTANTSANGSADAYTRQTQAQARVEWTDVQECVIMLNGRTVPLGAHREYNTYFHQAWPSAVSPATAGAPRAPGADASRADVAMFGEDGRGGSMLNANTGTTAGGTCQRASSSSRSRSSRSKAAGGAGKQALDASGGRERVTFTTLFASGKGVDVKPAEWEEENDAEDATADLYTMLV